MTDIVHLPPYRVSFPSVPLSEGVDWGVASYGIPELWKQTRGEGVTVAVVDSGIANHSALEVKDHRNFSSDEEAFDSLGHGCISPDDEVYTSACGVQKISTLFGRVDGVVHLLPDGSTVKDVSRLGIYTVSYDQESQKTVRRKVLAVHKLPYSGHVVRVSTRSGDMRFTPWHPVYVQTSQRGADRSVAKARADELRVGQRIVAARENEGVYSDTHSIPLAPAWKCRYCGHPAKGGARLACRQCGSRRWHSGPEARSIPLDEDLAFFLGLIASDGTVMRGSKTVGFFNNNRCLADEFSRLCVSLFGREPRELPPKPVAPSLISQRLNSCEAWDLCQRLGIQPNKSRSLEFPELIAKSNTGVILSFLAGVIEGDGSVCKKTGRIRIATGSEVFGKRIVSVCRFLGMHASIAAVQPSKTGFKTTLPSWAVRLGHSPALASRLRVKKLPFHMPQRDRRAVAVRGVTREEYTGDMYDLTVEGSHNYAANGLIVSNTHVAGTIAARSGAAKGIAPGCTLLSLKVLGHSGMGSQQAVANAVRYATEVRADIICMSLGATKPDDRVHSAIRDAHKAGVIVVCAAGNDGGAVNFPAAFPETVGVGAVDKNGVACEFSSRGKEIVVAAPGQDITSTWLANGYATISGTSMAAPFVAGVLALWLAKRKKETRPVTHQEVVAALQETCRDAGVTGRDPIYGWGLLDPHALVNYSLAPDGITIFIPGGRVL